MIFLFLYKQYSSNHINPLENVLQLLYFGSPHNVVFNKATIISECLSARYGVCVCVFWDWGLCVVFGLLFSWVWSLRVGIVFQMFHPNPRDKDALLPEAFSNHRPGNRQNKRNYVSLSLNAGIPLWFCQDNSY